MSIIDIRKESVFVRSIALIVLVTFNFSMVIMPSRAYAASAGTVLGLSAPGAMVNLSSAYVPVLTKGLRVHPENPILFDFIFDTGNTGFDIKSAQLKAEAEKTVKYFLASLTIPEDDQWVNLSPYEKNRIVPEQLGNTEMGRDMLAQDYMLKQITASLIYPEKELGKEFWNKVYAKAQALYGSTEIPVNTFNKVWIAADKANVFVHDNTAFVVQAHLKVMLEEDYLSLEKHNGIAVAPQTDTNKAHAIGNQIVREIVLPELEKEVNTGKNFANLRQIFYSMILATWYKKNLKEALLNQVYSNKAKINGVDVADKTSKEQIYQEYLKAYKKGVFNYIKEDMVNGQTVPRKYFSGGENFQVSKAMVVVNRIGPGDSIGSNAMISGQFLMQNANPAMTAPQSSDAAMLTLPTDKDLDDVGRMLGFMEPAEAKAELERLTRWWRLLIEPQYTNEKSVALRERVVTLMRRATSRSLGEKASVDIPALSHLQKIEDVLNSQVLEPRVVAEVIVRLTRYETNLRLSVGDKKVVEGTPEAGLISAVTQLLERARTIQKTFEDLAMTASESSNTDAVMTVGPWNIIENQHNFKTATQSIKLQHQKTGRQVNVQIQFVGSTGVVSIDGKTSPSFNIGFIIGKDAVSLVQSLMSNGALPGYFSASIQEALPLDKEFLKALESQGKAGGLQWLISHLKSGQVTSESDVIGVDWSGTNLKVAIVRVKPGALPQIVRQNEIKFPDELTKTGTEKEVLQFIAQGIKNLGLKDGQNYDLGLVFAFPMKHKSAKEAEVTGLTKGWTIDWIIGKDPGALLQQACDQDGQLKDKIRVRAVMNDTVATQLAVPNAMLGAIFGTGFNFSVTDPNSNEVINLEAGGFMDVPQILITDADIRIFNETKPYGKQRFEKMVSGKYLVQLLGARIDELKDQTELYPHFRAILASSFWSNEDNLTSEFLSAISQLKEPQEVDSVINKYLSLQVTLNETERNELIRLSTQLLERAGFLVGIVLGRALKVVDSRKHRLSYSIAIDGSVYTKNDVVKEAVARGLALFGWTSNNLTIFTPQTASAAGAGLAAALMAEAGPVDMAMVELTTELDDTSFPAKAVLQLQREVITELGSKIAAIENIQKAEGYLSIKSIRSFNIYFPHSIIRRNFNLTNALVGQYKSFGLSLSEGSLIVSNKEKGKYLRSWGELLSRFQALRTQLIKDAQSNFNEIQRITKEQDNRIDAVNPAIAMELSGLNSVKVSSATLDQGTILISMTGLRRVPVVIKKKNGVVFVDTQKFEKPTGANYVLYQVESDWVTVSIYPSGDLEVNLRRGKLHPGESVQVEFQENQADAAMTALPLILTSIELPTELTQGLKGWLFFYWFNKTLKKITNNNEQRQTAVKDFSKLLEILDGFEGRYYHGSYRHWTVKRDHKPFSKYGIIVSHRKNLMNIVEMSKTYEDLLQNIQYAIQIATNLSGEFIGPKLLEIPIERGRDGLGDWNITDVEVFVNLIPLIQKAASISSNGKAFIVKVKKMVYSSGDTLGRDDEEGTNHVYVPDIRVMTVGQKMPTDSEDLMALIRELLESDIDSQIQKVPADIDKYIIKLASEILKLRYSSRVDYSDYLHLSSASMKRNGKSLADLLDNNPSIFTAHLRAGGSSPTAIQLAAAIFVLGQRDRGWIMADLEKNQVDAAMNIEPRLEIKFKDDSHFLNKTETIVLLRTMDLLSQDLKEWAVKLANHQFPSGKIAKFKRVTKYFNYLSRRGRHDPSMDMLNHGYDLFTTMWVSPSYDNNSSLTKKVKELQTQLEKDRQLLQENAAKVWNDIEVVDNWQMPLTDEEIEGLREEKDMQAILEKSGAVDLKSQPFSTSFRGRTSFEVVTRPEFVNILGQKLKNPVVGIEFRSQKMTFEQFQVFNFPPIEEKDVVTFFFENKTSIALRLDEYDSDPDSPHNLTTYSVIFNGFSENVKSAAEFLFHRALQQASDAAMSAKWKMFGLATMLNISGFLYYFNSSNYLTAIEEERRAVAALAGYAHSEMYTPQQGDTYESISAMTGVPIATLKLYNHSEDPSKASILIIPGVLKYEVHVLAAGETPQDIAKLFFDDPSKSSRVLRHPLWSSTIEPYHTKVGAEAYLVMFLNTQEWAIIQKKGDLMVVDNKFFVLRFKPKTIPANEAMATAQPKNVDASGTVPTNTNLVMPALVLRKTQRNNLKDVQYFFDGGWTLRVFQSARNQVTAELSKLGSQQLWDITYEDSSAWASQGDPNWEEVMAKIKQKIASPAMTASQDADAVMRPSLEIASMFIPKGKDVFLDFLKKWKKEVGGAFVTIDEEKLKGKIQFPDNLSKRGSQITELTMQVDLERRTLNFVINEKSSIPLVNKTTGRKVTGSVTRRYVYSFGLESFGHSLGEEFNPPIDSWGSHGSATRPLQIQKSGFVEISKNGVLIFKVDPQVFSELIDMGYPVLTEYFEIISDAAMTTAEQKAANFKAFIAENYLDGNIDRAKFQITFFRNQAAVLALNNKAGDRERFGIEKIESIREGQVDTFKDGHGWTVLVTFSREVFSWLYPDQAMKVEIPGGIDLNSKNMAMSVSGQKIDIKFDPAMIAQFQRGDFSGVRAVIIDFTPIPSIFPLLGLREEEMREQLAKV